MKKMILVGKGSGQGEVTIGKVYQWGSEDKLFLDDKRVWRVVNDYRWEVCTTLSRQDIINKSVCFGTQEDGAHYTDMQLQPLQATYLRYGLIGLQAAIHTKVDKYITRKKNDPVVQLKKAEHCLSILREITELETC